MPRFFMNIRKNSFSLPKDAEDWGELANEFGTHWNFHNCCGAIDGKHIEIRKPSKSGSMYYNYKGFFSIILLAVVDAKYKFIWCNTGAPGSASDAGVFNACCLRPAREEGLLPFPNPQPFSGDDRDVPFFLVGDDAFPLQT